MILELFFVLIVLGPVCLFLYYSKKKSKKYRVFISVIVFVSSVSILSFVIVQMINNSEVNRRNKFIESQVAIDENGRHIYLNTNKPPVFVEYNMSFTNKEKTELNFKGNLNCNNSFSLYLRGHFLSIETPFTLNDSFRLPHSFKIRITDSLINELDCIDRDNFFKRARYSKEKHRWDLMVE